MQQGSNGYRWLYLQLLRLYPRAYRERFGEEMKQTFNDVYRERMDAGESIVSFALWTFTDTVISILTEHLSSLSSQFMGKRILIVAAITALLLMIPLIGMQVSDEWNWTASDFIFAATVIFVFLLAFEFLSRKGGNTAYRVATGLSLFTAFALLWINAAVGVIGDGDLDSPNALYLIVLAIGFFGGIATRFNARGMSLVLFAAAIMQMAVPLIALAFAPAAVFDYPPGLMGVLVLNAIFAMAFAASGYLYRQSAVSHA